MDTSYPTTVEPATPEYILTVLRDDHRQQCQYDPEAAELDVDLTFETTVAEWREACDLVGTYDLGRAENEIWGIRCGDDEWRRVLEPAGKRTLADVCELIARHASRPRIRPARLLGSNCTTAGIFLTVRSLLRDAGADADTIAPSTPLAPYTRLHADVFLGPVSRLVPGALPLVRIDGPKVYDWAGCWLGLGMLVLVIGSCFRSPALILVGALVAAISWLMMAIAASRAVPPERVEFGDLRTFRDLALALAGPGPGPITKGT